eukprot:c10227_g1_i1.p1 GENE.c10227_g1_i1~~c10227_g1_i1.p1  ORF type:complete len:261 (+),score=59.02 c10227_g1_i1:55-837(+)
MLSRFASCLRTARVVAIGASPLTLTLKSSCESKVMATILASKEAAPLVGPLMVKFLQIFPPAAAQLVFLAPMQAMSRIKAAGTTGDMTPLPYFAMLANCVAWSTYGLLLGDPTIWSPNVPGAFFSAYYIYTFHKYCSPTTSLTPHFAGLATVSSFIGATALVLDTSQALTVIGSTACVVTATMFAGPLAVMQTVLKQKSTEAMHFGFTVASFVNTTLWVMYGSLVAHNWFVIAPNAVGLAAALVQLGLFARFGIGKKKIV